MGKACDALRAAQEACQRAGALLGGLAARLAAPDADYVAAEQVMYHVRAALAEALAGCEALEAQHAALAGGPDEEAALLLALCQAAFAVREAAAAAADLHRPPDPRLLALAAGRLARLGERAKLHWLAARG